MQTALVVAAGAFSVQAQAYTVSLLPAAQTVSTGATVAVDVMLSDLSSQGVGSYDFVLGFDSNVLGFDRVEDGFSLGIALGLVPTLTGNSLRLIDFSLDDPLWLASQQAGDLTLFTVYFNAVNVGSSLLNMLTGTLSDVNGDIVSFTSNSATVTVQAGTPAPMPEPGTVGLLLAAAVSAALARRRQPQG
ncbi:hypothetical protein D621_02395 [beta proteobacterium AAP51]|nr:hypothetical protein D621_02395 [beta proteobacterium AAP51]